MTISTATLQDESLKTGDRSSQPASSSAKVFVGEFDAARPLPLANTSSLDDVLKAFGDDPELQAALTDARQNMAVTVYADEPQSLSALRLRAGLSQTQLSKRMGTSQSHVARIELGTSDPGTDVIARLAEALGVDEATAFNAVRYQRTSRAAHHDC